MELIKTLSDSKDGQKASVWGPIIWYLWFTIASQSSSDPIVVVTYLELYLELLYCRFCREAYNDFYFVRNLRTQWQKAAITDVNTVFITEWLHWLHEQVNAKLFKPSYPAQRLAIHYANVERRYWLKERVSTKWLKYWWISMYLLASNFQSQQYDAVVKMLTIAPQLIPGHIDREQILRAMPQQSIPNHRHKLFRYIYEWETRCTQSSLFGNTIEDVATYFETHFRAE